MCFFFCMKIHYSWSNQKHAGVKDSAELDFLSMPIWHLLQIFPSFKLLYTSVEDVWHHHKDVTSSLIAANIDAGGTYHGCFSRGHLWKYETCIPQGTRKHVCVCVFVEILFLCFGLSDALSFQWHELLWSWQHSWASVSDCFDDVNCHDLDNTFRLVFFIWKLTHQSVFVLLHMRAEIFLEFVNVQASAPKQPSKHWHGCE